jgi:hypothetical protein
MMLDGMKQLQQIGAQIVTQREQAAAALPPAVDPKATSKDKDAGKKTVTKTKAKKK